MAYTKTSWVARVGTALNRFLKANESSASVELTADPTGVSTAGTPFTADNMNKIEQGIYDAHEALDANGLSAATPRINQGVKTTDSPTFATVNTGQGANELYAMNQNVRTTDAVTFSSVNTGHGANELYPMNQAVRTTDSPTFAKLTLTTSTYGTQDIAGNGSWVVPVGIYMFPLTTDILVEIWSGSDWIGNRAASGALISDGSNIRINNEANPTRTIFYRKFS